MTKIYYYAAFAQFAEKEAHILHERVPLEELYERAMATYHCRSSGEFA